MTEKELEKLKKLQTASDECWELRKKLILDGLAFDNEAIVHLDARLWLYVFRIYELTKGEAAAAQLLSDMGLHQN